MIIQGTANYSLSVIDVTKGFSRIYYILQYSCYGTISTKFRTSIFKLFNKFRKFPIFKIELEIKFKNKTPLNIAPETKTNKDIIFIEITPYKNLIEKALKY